MQTHLPDYLLTDLLATVAFGVVAILLIVLGYITFDKLTPKLDFSDLLNKGNVALSLERMRQVPQSPDGCSEFERVLLGDLELTQKYMQRVMGKSQEQQRLTSRAFHAQSHLLTAGILSRSPAFFHTLRQLHDRNGQA